MGQHTERQDASRDGRRMVLFEDRYGEGALARLTTRLKQPCVSFASIAAEFGVTRERVRQWHLDLLPGAPQGHARRRLCQEYRRKRTLLADPLFRGFYHDVRRHLGAGRLALIRSAEGFRLRRVHLDGRVVALGHAHREPAPDERSRRRRPRAPHPWGDADFVYLRLSDGQFLFLPSALARADVEAHADGSEPDRARYLNTFGALGRASHPAAPDPAYGASDDVEWS